MTDSNKTRCRWMLAGAAVFSMGFVVTALFTRSGRPSRRWPTAVERETFARPPTAAPGKAVSGPRRVPPVHLAPGVGRPSEPERAGEGTEVAKPLRPFNYQRLDLPRPGEEVDPGPVVATPPVLAGAPTSGTTLPITLSEPQLRAIQIERLVGLRTQISAPPAADDKAADVGREMREQLMALEVWAGRAGVKPDELVAAQQRLAERAETARALPDLHVQAR